MFGLFNKKSSVTTELLQRIAQCKSSLPSEATQTGSPLLVALENAVSKQWTADHIKNYAAQIDQGDSHEAFIYNYLIHTCADRLESGRYHVYRGVLNDEGRKYMAILEHSISKMVAAGGYTAEWAEENLRKPVMKGIAEMG